MGQSFSRRGREWGGALLLAGLFAGIGRSESDLPENLQTENLVAWCVVAFDAKERTPEQRVQMLKDLGMTRCAYDWRAKHVPTFEAEIRAYQEHGIEFYAFWGEHEEAFALFEKYDLRPQIWRTLRGGEEATQAERVKAAADRMEPLARRLRELDCVLGLYNHGGWGGQPENLAAVCRELRERGFPQVGVVYNFHHAHDQIDRWEEAFAAVQPYLLCLNLNGMVRRGDQEGEKILTLGQGEEEAAMLRFVLDSGYRGPIGILDHRPETDSVKTLRENLEGLERITKTGRESGVE